MQGYEPFTLSDPAALRKSLEPGDVLRVEGNSHISRVIKYLTQSTWSHAALYVGPIEGVNTHEGEPHVLIEAEIGEGVEAERPTSPLCGRGSSFSNSALPTDAAPDFSGPELICDSFS